MSHYYFSERAAMLPQLLVGVTHITPAGSHAFPAYRMGYGERLDLRRAEAFLNGGLDARELVMLSQDIIEAGQLFHLGPGALRLVEHCVSTGLSTVSGRGLQ
jgi:hypothetical protein